MDEVYLSNDVFTGNSIKLLSLTNYVDSFISTESSLSTPEVLKMLASPDPPADESAILLHYVVEVFGRAMLATLW